jgi:hypothetical protein
MLPGGKLTVLAYNLIKKVNKAEESISLQTLGTHQLAKARTMNNEYSCSCSLSCLSNESFPNVH